MSSSFALAHTLEVSSKRHTGSDSTARHPTTAASAQLFVFQSMHTSALLFRVVRLPPTWKSEHDRHRQHKLQACSYHLACWIFTLSTAFEEPLGYRRPSATVTTERTISMKQNILQKSTLLAAGATAALRILQTLGTNERQVVPTTGPVSDPRGQQDRVVDRRLPRDRYEVGTAADPDNNKPEGRGVRWWGCLNVGTPRSSRVTNATRTLPSEGPVVEFSGSGAVEGGTRLADESPGE